MILFQQNNNKMKKKMYMIIIQLLQFSQLYDVSNVCN